MSVVIGYVHPSEVNAVFSRCLINMLMEDRKGDMIIGGVIDVSSGPRIASARNQVVRRFMSMGVRDESSGEWITPEWLLMLDADMTFDVDLARRLLDFADAKERPILGGLCFGGGKSGVVFPTLYLTNKPEPNRQVVETVWNYPKDALCQVDATGAACLLIHRSVFEKMATKYAEPYPWFAESAHGQMEFGEDWTFCVRAAMCDFPVFVHTGIKVGHMKEMLIDEQMFEQYRDEAQRVGQAGVTTKYQARVLGKEFAPEIGELFAVIPMRDKADLTIKAARSVMRQRGAKIPTKIVIIDDRSSAAEMAKIRSALKDAKIITARDPQNISSHWNQGIEYATAEATGQFEIMFLNNDAQVSDVEAMQLALRSDDSLAAICPNYDSRTGLGVQYVTGTYGSRGMSGFAFMVKGELLGNGPLHYFDESMRWWYSDDDFALRCATNGLKVGIYIEANCTHQISSTASEYDFSEQIKADKERFVAKWHLSETVH